MEQKKSSSMMVHADLFVSSMAQALEFYCGKLDFSVVDETIVDGDVVRYMSSGSYRSVRLVLVRSSKSGPMLELLEYQKESALKENASDLSIPTGMVSFLVGNLRYLVDSAKSRGLDPASEIFTIDLPRQGRCAVTFFEDPDRNRLEFLQVLTDRPS